MNESKKYKRIRVLGKGSFGIVYLVNNEIENQLYAMKVKKEKILLFEYMLL